MDKGQRTLPNPVISARVLFFLEEWMKTHLVPQSSFSLAPTNFHLRIDCELEYNDDEVHGHFMAVSTVSEMLALIFQLTSSVSG